MKNILKPTLILLIICLISSSILSVLYSNTKPIIEKNNKEAMKMPEKQFCRMQKRIVLLL